MKTVEEIRKVYKETRTNLEFEHPGIEHIHAATLIIMSYWYTGKEELKEEEIYPLVQILNSLLTEELTIN